MSATYRIFCAITLPLSSSPALHSRAFPFVSCSLSHFILHPSLTLPASVFPFTVCRDSRFTMPYNQRRGGRREQKWKEKAKVEGISTESETASEVVTNALSNLRVTESNQPHIPITSVQFGNAQPTNLATPGLGHRAIWKPKAYGTTSGAAVVEGEKAPAVGTSIENKGSNAEIAANSSAIALSQLLKGNQIEQFTVDNSAYTQAQIRATFYPKFENEKSDQEIRTRMIEMVSKGLATLEVSLKHSGSLFMYAGHQGGAYAKNSFGNIYTAVGVFVLGRMFREAWGSVAPKKQAEFNDFLESNRMCISMELVTAVLGDHGQRPREDYVVVTAVTELGNGKPKFYSTSEIIAFCRKWRLPTNHVWLFSSRKSVTSFFASFDALCEEGTATTVCKALDEVAEISVPGSKDHIKVQGEILEGLVARMVSHESSKHMEKVLEEFPALPYNEGGGLDLGPSLREICAANRSDEKQQIKALLQNVGSAFCPDHSDWYGDSHSRNADRSVVSKFLQAKPADFSTSKLQEMVRLMRERRLPAAFKCYHNFHKIGSISNDNLFYKMVIHVQSDSAFRRYQKEMRHKPGLWPLYRGFFVDINLFKENKEKTAEIVKSKNNLMETEGNGTVGRDGFADEDANLMIKLKFLTYKLRTFLIRNGLSILFKEGSAAYKAYYLRQMKLWGTSFGKQRELSKMLDEWAVYLRRKYGNKQLSSSIYLSEAEPFLEQYAKRSPQNQALIGSAGNLVRAEDFLAVVEEGMDEEGDLQKEDAAPSSPMLSRKDVVPKAEGLIVFFPGIPGCAKSALCREILNAPGGLGDDRPVNTLMGDLIKGRYWQKVADERRRKPYSIMLADKNAPNEEVWRQIEDMCHSTRASAVPVIPDSEGTDSNPFSLDALAVFMFRVLQRVNHPGNLDKASPNAGYVLLMFYHLYEGKSRREFEGELIDRFGSLVKIPLLKSDRSPLPDNLKTILEEGLSLYKLHTSRHGRADSTKGSYAKEWAKWEKQLRETLFGNAEYLNAIQVPFEFAVQNVLEQLKKISKGDYKSPITERRKSATIVYAAVSLPVQDIQDALDTLGNKNPQVEAFIKEGYKDYTLKSAHVTLAHKRSHGIKAVADYGIFENKEVPVELTALLFSDKMAAFEARVGSIEDERVISKNEWPHVTLWTREGIAAKEANTLPQLVSEGKATLVELNPPIIISGKVQFF
ncbi:tRNA ligase 1 isoform X1 [Cucurbita moschata]|uniref:tRNA ligase 1 isoform X1 n=2 Tax=Cucurbita moschata TaxID=3662 RepID=A0A6J1HM92_CUCMO|nr:tRNA ligase 1 isoform X1 [Cucurbita moschata]